MFALTVAEDEQGAVSHLGFLTSLRSVGLSLPDAAALQYSSKGSWPTG